MTTRTLCDCGSCRPTVVPTHLQAFVVTPKKTHYGYRIFAALPLWAFLVSPVVALAEGNSLAGLAALTMALIAVVKWDRLVEWMGAVFVLPPQAVYAVVLLAAVSASFAPQGGPTWLVGVFATSVPLWLRRGGRAATLHWLTMALVVLFAFYATLRVFDLQAGYLPLGSALLVLVLAMTTHVSLLVALVRSALWNSRCNPRTQRTPAKMIALFYVLAAGLAAAVTGSWSVLPLVS